MTQKIAPQAKILRKIGLNVKTYLKSEIKIVSGVKKFLAEIRRSTAPGTKFFAPAPAPAQYCAGAAPALAPAPEQHW